MIYHWEGKDAVAPIAAAIHLGYFPPSVKTGKELHFLLRQQLPFRKGVGQREVGTILQLGQGRKGETVFILAVGRKPDLVLKTINKMLPLLDEDPTNYLFINCKAYLNRNNPMEVKARPRLCGWYNAIGQLVDQVQRNL